MDTASLDKYGVRISELEEATKQWSEMLKATKAEAKSGNVEIENTAGEDTGGVRQYSIKEIVDLKGNSYGIGVFLDSDVFGEMTEEERIGEVNRRLREMGGQSFVAYDNDGNAIKIRIAHSSQRYKNQSGNRKPVNKDLVSYLKNNEVKQEAIILVDEIIASAKYSDSSKSKYPHDWLDANGQNDWDYWTVYIQDKNKTVWEATLNVANTANGEKILYDIYPIKEAEQSVSSDTSLPTNSISETTEKSNPQNSEKTSEVAAGRGELDAKNGIR